MKLLRRAFFLLVLAAAPGAALAQALPYHADPSAREETDAPAGVPAIRFLTSTGFPPFNYRDGNGQLVGFNVDLASAICEITEVSCTMQAWPWEQAANALSDNQGDALIAGLAISPEMAERFDFSVIYMMLPARFVTAKPLAFGFDVRASIAGAIAVREGSAQAAFLAAALPGVSLAPYPTEIEALEAVRSGDAEAYFGDAMRASFWLNQNLDCCAFAGEPYFNAKFFGEGLSIAVPSGRGAVREALDIALDKLKDNGKLDELYLRWFPVSFY